MSRYSIAKLLSINASPAVVFEALTNSKKIVQYFPLSEVVSDWRVGSEILCKGIVNGHPFIDYGTIDILIPNTQFQYTYWSDNHGIERTPENFVTIGYTLTPSREGTVLTLEHRNLPSETMYMQMLGVWDFLLGNLKKYVERL